MCAVRLDSMNPHRPNPMIRGKYFQYFFTFKTTLYQYYFFKQTKNSIRLYKPARVLEVHRYSSRSVLILLHDRLSYKGMKK
jgi:hypothetical protein